MLYLKINDRVENVARARASASSRSQTLIPTLLVLLGSSGATHRMETNLENLVLTHALIDSTMSLRSILLRQKYIRYFGQGRREGCMIENDLCSC
jgi:hypothetical protein